MAETEEHGKRICEVYDQWRDLVSTWVHFRVGPPKELREVIFVTEDGTVQNKAIHASAAVVIEDGSRRRKR